MLSLMFLPVVAFAQSGGIGGGTIISSPERTVLPPREISTWRDSGSGLHPMSRLEACSNARRDGNTKISAQTYTLRNRVIKGSTMSECSCEGPAAGGWYKCTVDISVTYSNI